MKGYWNNPEETEEVLRDGWLYTGDLGYMDDKGYFYIADRKGDMIIAAGYNVYPREIEEVLYEYERSEEHTSELQSRGHLVCRLLLEKKNRNKKTIQKVVG